MDKIRFGVLGNAKIGWEKVFPAFAHCQQAQLYALASRNRTQASAVAQQFGIAKLYDHYDQVLADPQVDAVYIPLPNQLHVEWALKAAAAGKHVLCEKPMGLRAAEVSALAPYEAQVQIMEAFMVRFHPQWLRVREALQQGKLGTVHTIQAFFAYYNTDASNIRNQVHTGGGTLYDIGCYPIAMGRWLFGREPVRAMALMTRDPVFGTDVLCSALIDFGQGQRLDFTVCTQSVPYQRVHIVGTQQRIEVQIPFNAPLNGPTQLRFSTGAALDGSQDTIETLDACNMYSLQMDAFAQAIQTQTPLPWGVVDAVANLRVIEALMASEQQQGWVDVA